MPNKHGQPVIAIDGTSASGKSTLSEELARAYGAKRFEYSLFFRLIALHMLEEGFDPAAKQAPTAAQEKEAARHAREDLSWEEINRLKSDDRLRTIKVSQTAPYFSGLPEVLASTDIALQTLIDASRDQPVIAEGRTIGKYVYPNADVKLYIDAELSIRGERRAETLRAKGKELTNEEVAADLATRDHQDQTRTHQPTGFDETVHTRLDTSHHAISETLDASKSLIEAKLPSLTARAQQKANSR